MKLASAVSDNKKGFVKSINSKRRSKGHTGLILVDYGHLTNRDNDKAEAFIIFASVFNNTGRPWAAQSPELEGHECRNNDFPLMDT